MLGIPFLKFFSCLTYHHKNNIEVAERKSVTCTYGDRSLTIYYAFKSKTKSTVNTKDNIDVYITLKFIKFYCNNRNTNKKFGDTSKHTCNMTIV